MVNAGGSTSFLGVSLKCTEDTRKNVGGNTWLDDMVVSTFFRITICLS